MPGTALNVNGINKNVNGINESLSPRAVGPEALPVLTFLAVCNISRGVVTFLAVFNILLRLCRPRALAGVLSEILEGLRS